LKVPDCLYPWPDYQRPAGGITARSSDHLLAASSIRRQVAALGRRLEAEQATDAQQQGEMMATVGGDRYRHGEPIASGFVESAVRVSKRFVKRQQMAWRPQHAHDLLQARTAVLNDQFRSYVERWYPSIAREEDHRITA